MAKRPDQVAPSPMWTLDKGISYSLLSRFINCRERFRLYSVEGVRETSSSSKEQMDFGTYFHELLELHAKYPHLTSTGVSRKAKKKITKPQKAIADLVFKQYCDWYSDSRYKYAAQEQEFCVPYTLPNGRTVKLVGKSDEIIAAKDGTLWVQENKTKEKFNEYKIESSIPFDLQTLMYCIAIEKLFKKPVTGFVYNVIRKPTHKPSKVKEKILDDKTQKMITKTRVETTAEFHTRLSLVIANDPAHFFKRWEFALTPEHMLRWRQTTFDPLLTQLCMWWESVKHDPFSPWVLPNGEPNPHHHQRPFGVYDPMTNGTGDFFDLITRNRRIGTTSGNKCFSELPATHPAKAN